MFGKEYVSPNVHGTFHLPDDVMRLGVGLDSFSAFKFENFIRHLKALLRTPAKPLEQISNRLIEYIINDVTLTQEEKYEKLLRQQKHFDGSLINSCKNPQYKKIVVDGLTFTTTTPNYCCQVDSDIVVIENFATSADGNLSIIGRKYIFITDLYETPCQSSVLGIFKVRGLSKLYSCPAEKLQNKFFRIPMPQEKKTFAVFPFCHV